MKRYMNIIKTLIIAVATFAALAPAHAYETSVKTLWSEGNEAYAAEEYDAAIAAYSAIVERGYESDILYYNLGNAYFKRGQGNVDGHGKAFNSGELGRAILNYERALKINPELDDARYNRDLAYKLTNAPDEVPVGFLTSMWRSMSGVFSSNTWTITSLVMFFITLALVLLYLLANNIVLRKVSFFVSIITLLAFILTTACAITQRDVQLDSSRAVIVCNDTQAIHSEPSNKSKVIREHSQGVVVEVLRSEKEWAEVKFADGEKGWILTDAIEVI